MSIESLGDSGELVFRTLAQCFGANWIAAYPPFPPAYFPWLAGLFPSPFRLRFVYLVPTKVDDRWDGHFPPDEIDRTM